MTRYLWTLPSKTFLVGEYCVLREGPSILLATEPRFQLNAEKGESFTAPFHTQSPAGRFYSENRDELAQWDLTFSDPHHEKGGFGASSAQLLALMALHTGTDTRSLAIRGRAFLKEFSQLAERAGFLASGADMMAQMAGQVVFFRREPFQLESHRWTFPSLEFVLLRTGAKVATHEHLRELTDFAMDVPVSLVEVAQQAILSRDSETLVRCVTEYRHWLNREGFESAPTAELLAELETSQLTLAAKGCGAMGADVIVVLLEPVNRPRLLSWAEQRHLQVVATTEQLAPGLTASWEAS
jgi:mevalonate kinase